MIFNKLLILCAALLFSLVLPAQSKSTITDSLSTVLSEKYLNNVDSKISSIDRDIESKTLKLLGQMQRQEERLQQKLQSGGKVVPDQSAAIKSFYQSLAEQIKNPAANTTIKEYLPDFDSLKTGIAFLSQAGSLTSKLPGQFNDKLKSVNINMSEFQNRFQKAEGIKTMIRDRSEMLKQRMEKLGASKELAKINKQVYYYQQQLDEYKSMLKDKKKIEQRALQQLTQLPAFTTFMRKNSQFAQLFHVPDNTSSTDSIPGLQTIASVQNELRQKFGKAAFTPQGGAAGGQNYLQMQVQQAQGALTTLKDKIIKAGGGSSDMQMPDFKPNSQKTKSFLKRIEYGANVQSQKTNAFLPVTSDIALTAGYKLNDKSVIGVGASYKMGWGNGIKDIRITNEGMGLRSYVDVKVKGSIWISGGYEQNYQKSFANINQLKNLSYWQTSGLIGITKKYKIAKKTNNLQLLWDFLSYRQVPRRQPVLFRIGYVF